ncbi:3-(3-hydroxy-phenyl)propionate transporter MhpT [Acinetobacter sp. MB5]|uniref:3-(3-hydroxy-phenyl)propionate transporter MhpT n=1 Tax=Acinetobacter sp. MB5 TaxID=2069438 RepID=UPI000DCFC724|nr:3-(3-hydroxy-phenyl)propionate transporter MhpT [Acinetobacter sp. MB5]
MQDAIYIQQNKRKAILTLLLCFMVALLEGFDIQSMGVAAPFIKAEFGLITSQLAWVFSAATLGMFPGALIGGRLADRYGRKRILMISVAIFGIMSLTTAFCINFSSFVIVRFLTGIGMGAALPMMIAIASECVAPRYIGTAVSIMYTGVPAGAAVTALMARYFSDASQWTHIFYLGGWVPLLILPLLFFFLAETIKKPAESKQQGISFSTVLFADNRLGATLQIWISFFCTLIVLYFILNWLPILMRINGLDNQKVNMIQLVYQLGAAVGTLVIGQLLDRIQIKWVVIAIYTGVLTSLICLAFSNDYYFLTGAAALCGFFLTGGQSALYALAALIYPAEMRGTGVGVAVAVGRIGSFVGPLFAGLILSLSSSSSTVIGASIPVIGIATFAALLLVFSLNRNKNRLLA